MNFLCKQCNRANIENEPQNKKYLVTLRKKQDKSLYKKHTINNLNLDEYDEKINDNITTQNNNFDFCSISCEFKLEFDNKVITSTETIYFHNIDNNNIKSYFLYSID